MTRFSTTHWQFGRAVFSSFVRGRWFFDKGHLPTEGKVVGDGFFGVGVAASDDPAVDAFILDRLHEAGITHVRLDYASGDETGPTQRLLERLCAANIRVSLHLIQARDDARRMPSSEAGAAWRTFVAETLDRVGRSIESVEIGSTANRKRWTGHSLEGFLQMWEIAWQEVRKRNLKLIGPSVTDFETPWNVGMLALLRQRGQLPDIHSDNLFSERCTEPERYDHKVLGRRYASLHKYNLIKKARLLQRIGADYGLPALVSPAAFWTLPRIERMFPDSEQKQADYLVRYFVLCIASGALDRAWWGPLICHREGLIDNGKRPYPALERITHYAHVEGDLADLRARPAFSALRNLVSLTLGTCYLGRKSGNDGLEVHAFESGQGQVHVAWTPNGKAAALSDIYQAADLADARIIDRDGIVIEPPCAEFSLMVCENPIFLTWPTGRSVSVKPGAALLKDVALACHASDQRYFFFRDDVWQGIILARDSAEAKQLLPTIHPDFIGRPVKEATLRHARNAIWTLDDPRGSGRRLVVKQPVKMHLHKRLLDRFKPTKALRSWNGTNELLRRGIAAAPPVAYFEKHAEFDGMRNYYICEYVATKHSVRELVSAFARGETDFLGSSEDEAFEQLSNYLLAMHGRGVFFRDLSGGNILVDQGTDGKLSFVLIDTGRIHAYDQPLPISLRVADLVRTCNKMNAPGRERFLQRYMGALKHRLSWWDQLSFSLYDFKVVAKRNFGRKAIKRVLGSKS